MLVFKFMQLEWKQFFRSSYWQKNIFLNIILVLFGLILLLNLLVGGFLFNKILQKIAPNVDPLSFFYRLMFYWIMLDLMTRFFLQKLPVMQIKPLLTQNIKKPHIVHYILSKSLISFFNIAPLVFIIPFGLGLLQNGYETTTIGNLIVFIFLLTLITNYLYFALEAITSQYDYGFYAILGIFAGITTIDYLGWIDLKGSIASMIEYIVQNPWTFSILIVVLFLVYKIVFVNVKKQLFLDASLKGKSKQVNSSDLAWLNRLGDLAPFVKLDLRLIWRNKRSKGTALMMIMGCLYGLFFFPNPVYQDSVWVYPFVGIFSTGIFLISFGQFIPAWDSSYYKLLMSQNIKYQLYLKSKFTLMVLSVAFLWVLTLPYAYFGVKALMCLTSGALYNIGVNSHVILFGGSFNRKRIEINERAAFNYQGTSAVQWLLGIPLMLIPVLIFIGINWISNFEIATLVISILGVTGIVLHKNLMKIIRSKYLLVKHPMIEAFGQKS